MEGDANQSQVKINMNIQDLINMDERNQSTNVSVFFW